MLIIRYRALGLPVSRTRNYLERAATSSFFTPEPREGWRVEGAVSRSQTDALLAKCERLFGAAHVLPVVKQHGQCRDSQPGPVANR